MRTAQEAYADLQARTVASYRAYIEYRADETDTMRTAYLTAQAIKDAALDSYWRTYPDDRDWNAFTKSINRYACEIVRSQLRQEHEIANLRHDLANNILCY